MIPPQTFHSFPSIAFLSHLSSLPFLTCSNPPTRQQCTYFFSILFFLDSVGNTSWATHSHLLGERNYAVFDFVAQVTGRSREAGKAWVRVPLGLMNRCLGLVAPCAFLFFLNFTSSKYCMEFRMPIVLSILVYQTWLRYYI